MARPSYGSFVTDLTRALASWEEQYVSEVSYRKYERACAWVTDQSAKAVSLDMRGATDTVFRDATPWMRNAWQYRRSLGKGRSIRDGVESEAYVLDDQSAVLKYEMGQGLQTRRPGDVGLAQDRILVPHWKNLALTQGIRPNGSHDLPGATMARLIRNSQGQYARRSVPGRWGVYKGEVTLRGGSRLMGYIARPPRVKAMPGEHGTPKTVFTDRRNKGKEVPHLVNLGRPRILLVQIPQARYSPVMQRPFEDAVADARRGVADLMAGQLAENIRHEGYRSAKSRLGDVLGALEKGGRSGAYDREGPAMDRGRALRTEATGLLARMKALSPTG